MAAFRRNHWPLCLGIRTLIAKAWQRSLHPSAHAAPISTGIGTIPFGVWEMLRVVAVAMGAGLIGLLGGCQTTADQAAVPGAGVPTTATVQEPTDVQYYPSDEPVRMGREHFGRGNYGIAERYFRDAVEKSPRDATGWVGLAASYDRLRRFDLADRAYAQAIKLTGETVQILNNQGYSLMLRGDLQGARRKFLRSYELDPNNPTIANNLELLNASRRSVQRAPDAM